MRKNRITALCLSLVLAVTYSLGNVQTAQAAAITLTPQMIEVLYAILGSAGAIAVTNGVDKDKKSVIKNWYADEKGHIVNGMELIAAFQADEGGNYRYQGDLDFGNVKQRLTELRDSFVGYIDTMGLGDWAFPSFAGYELCKDWALSTDGDSTNWQTFATGPGIYVLRGYYTPSDGFYNVRVCGVRPNAYGMQVSRLTSPVRTYDRDHTNTYYGNECKLRYTTSTSENGRKWFSWQLVKSDGTVYVNTSSAFDGSASFCILIGNGKAFGAGLVDVSRLLPALCSAIGSVDTGIDCDTWAGTLGRSLADENKDVIILGGQDLAGYDDVDTVREGLITGVDWDNVENPDIPIDPDIPVDPDVPAEDSSILSILKKILEWLKGLPALLAETIIGDGVLDWSGFQGVQLSSVFPFCIPWDLANCVRGFNVQPTEPVFVFDFAGTPLSSAGTVRYDLSRFAVVIPIVRYFIYGIFVVGLIVKTRDLIRG